MEGTESVNGVVKDAGRWAVGASVGEDINSGCYQWKRAHSLPILFRFRFCFPSLSPSRFSILTSLFCMAANSKGRAIAGSFGKRFVNQIWASRNPAPIAASAASDSRRGVHASSYDKNVEEEQVHPVVVPDHVIETSESEKYWGPDPTTGVFGPAATAGTKDGLGNAGDGGGSTVLDQEVWFRPLEDVDKPPHQPGLN